MPRYSREDALSERELVLLLRGARELDAPRDYEARLAIMCAARLGMRGGEIIHLSADWINWADRMIEIPAHDPCTKGKDGRCGYCRHRARDIVETNNVTLDEARATVQEEHGTDLGDEAVEQLAAARVEDNRSFEEVLEEYWQPKTENAARAIPFDHDVRLQLCIERFAEEYEVYPRSKATMNRRVDAAAEAADLEGRVYPHALRATAATQAASRSVSTHAIMGIMGWATMGTARSYISASGESAARELRSKFR